MVSRLLWLQGSKHAQAEMPSDRLSSWAMAEVVVVFHHALRLADPVRRFADALRDAGHTVHTPDLYDGRTFNTIEDGDEDFEIAQGRSPPTARPCAAPAGQAPTAARRTCWPHST